jgi:hypothetical protein
LALLDSFKLWAEQVFGWYYFVERSVYEPSPSNRGGKYVRKMIKKRLINKQYLIVGRGAAKSLYDSCIHSYFHNVDTSTTHQITTAPTMKQADEVMSPIRTAITRSRGPLFKFLTEGSLQNTTGSKANTAEKINKVVPNADLYFSGHTHGKQSHSDIVYMFDDESGELVPHKRTYVVGGSFVEYWDAYPEMKGLAPSATGLVRCELRPDYKDIRVTV